MESLVICTAAQYCKFGLMKGDEMEMGFWNVWGEERGKQDFGGYTRETEATWNIQT